MNEQVIFMRHMANILIILIRGAQKENDQPFLLSQALGTMFMFVCFFFNFNFTLSFSEKRSVQPRYHLFTTVLMVPNTRDQEHGHT